MIRIYKVTPLDGFNVELTLSDGRVIRRDLEPFLIGQVFERLHYNAEQFREVRVDEGALVWPGGADLGPDMVIWGGLPPADAEFSAA